jgi:lycopene cyclase domain-containing protein
MLPQELSYGLFEIAIFLACWLVVYSVGASSSVLTCRFALLTLAIYLVWLGWDLAAIRAGVFVFPADGSLPVRLLGVPLEEHAFFFVHAFACWSAVVAAEATQGPRSEGD